MARGAVVAEWFGHALPLYLYDSQVAIIRRMARRTTGRDEYYGSLTSPLRAMARSNNGMHPTRFSPDVIR